MSRSLDRQLAIRSRKLIAAEKSLWATALLVISTVLAPAGLTAASGPSGRTLFVSPTPRSPNIDGILDDPCWQQATMASGFITVWNYWATQQATGYVTYDDSCLYIAFRCNKVSGKLVRALTLSRDDRTLFTGDTVEICLDTNLDRQTYFHLAASPNAITYEASCSVVEQVQSRKDEWNADWRVKTSIANEYWTAEISIPFASLGKGRPSIGEVWGINLGRTDKITASTPSSWPGTPRTFNSPEHFGKLVFGKSPDVSYSIHAFEQDAHSMELNIRLRNHKNKPLAIRLELSVRTGWGTTNNNSQVAHLDPAGERQIKLVYRDPSQGYWPDIPIGSIDYAELSLVVREDQNGTIYDVVNARCQLESPAAMDLTADRFYYTPDVRQMQVILATKSSEGSYFEIEISDRPATKAAAFRKRVPIVPDKDRYIVPVDIADWDLGRHVVSAHLYEDDGNRLASAHRVFIRREIPPAESPARVKKVQIRSGGIILLNGKPFFPFLASTGGQPPAFVKDCFNVLYGDANVVSKPLGRPSLDMTRYVVEGTEGRFLAPDEKEWFQRLRTHVEPRTLDESFFYWALKYEANHPLYREQGRVRLDNAKVWAGISRFVKSIDSKHLTCIQIEGPPFSSYKDSADVIEVACPSSYARQIIPNLINDIQNIRNELGPDKPFIVWIGSSIPSPNDRTAEQIRAASYLALMNGASGIIFHMGHGGIAQEYTRHWSVYTGLSREIQRLFVILTAPQQGIRPTVKIDRPEIHYRLRESDGIWYLTAINTSFTSVKAAVHTRTESFAPISAIVPFENRRIEVAEDGSFSDTFTAFEPHVYQLELAEE